MFPIRDDNPTLATPVTTIMLIGLNVAAWVLVQGMGAEPLLSKSVCELGLIPGVLTPQSRAGFARQVAEVLDSLNAVLAQQPQPMTITVQTIFLRDAADQSACERVFARHFGSELPVTNFVLQPPCCGAALALEASALAEAGKADGEGGWRALQRRLAGIHHAVAARRDAVAVRRAAGRRAHSRRPAGS